MLFNSFEYLLFLPLVYSLYWSVKSSRFRTMLLLVASYFFYGWWDWRFLGLIAASSLLDYFVGRQLGATENTLRRKWLLAISLTANLGLLMYFKYANFFLESFLALSKSLGIQANVSSLSIILPVGISFYTFQTLSYTIDVYRRTLPPERDLLNFATYVSFFPQLVAGPIERAGRLLPQFRVLHRFDRGDAAIGIKQILWGLFLKTVIADNAATFVNHIFAEPGIMSSTTLMLGTVLFAFQIYGDFAGYSEIAIGTARLFGFRLMTNFRYPYLSRDIAEFWRRWHISLSTWFRDYLYIPLGGSRGGRWVALRNIIIIFLVSGFWHGANWTFVFWGLLNGLLFIPLYLLGRNRLHLDVVASRRSWLTVSELLNIGLTFTLVCICWVFFRADSITLALEYLGRMFSGAAGEYLLWSALPILGVIAVLMIIEWVNRRRGIYFAKSRRKVF